MSLAREFIAARDEWHAATSYMSNMGEAQRHPAYQRVIAMGMDVVPIILRELQTEPDHWMTALTAITGEDPVKEEDWGRLKRMSDSWVRWGRRKGII